MELKKVKYVYLIGAGGIGMSALARYFKKTGKHVAGYDRMQTALTDQLKSEGVVMTYGSEPDRLPVEFKLPENRGTTMVVYTPAVPAGNPLLKYFSENGYNLLKRAELLGKIFNNACGVAVAGTHGKTTVSTMAAHIFKQSQVDCTAFLGGISRNYNTNFLMAENSDIIVAEADEFDRSLLRLSPKSAVITSVDTDHLDIYKSFGELKETFTKFAGVAKEKGDLLLHKDVTRILNLSTGPNVFSYSLKEEADYYAVNLRITGNGLYRFDLVTPSGNITGLETGVPGLINVENIIAASAVALINGVKREEVKKAVKSFQGVSRRMDVRINTPEIVFIDDYAHHPKEINAFISSLREIYPGRKITGIFQPHLYSRTRDFAEEFARSLEMLDCLILLDIYPAREAPIEGVNSGIIFKEVNLKQKYMCNYNELLNIIGNFKFDLLVTIGAGDIDKLVGPLEKRLKTEKLNMK